MQTTSIMFREVREFIKDTRPKTNTTRGGRFAATVGTCFYSITCPPSWPLFPLQDKKRLVFEGTVGAATRPLSSSSPRTTSASSSRTKARAAAAPHSWAARLQLARHYQAQCSCKGVVYPLSSWQDCARATKKRDELQLERGAGLLERRGGGDRGGGGGHRTRTRCS